MKSFAETQNAMLAEIRKLIDEGQFGDALQLISELLANRGPGGDEEVDVRLLSLQSIAYYHTAEYSLALSTAREALERVIDTSDNDLIADLQSTVARCLTELGEIAQAERAFHDLISTYRRLGDTRSVIRTLNRLARVYFIRGELDHAVNSLLEANSYAQELEDEAGQAMILGNLGTILNLSGRFRKAIEYLLESVRLNRRAGRELNLARAQLSHAYALMHLKEFAAAENALKEAQQLLERFPESVEAATLWQYRAQMALLRNAPAAAAGFAQQAANLRRSESSRVAEDAQVGRLLAEALLQCGELEEAERIASEALDVATAVGEQIEIGACHRVLGQILYLLGRTDNAEECFADAVHTLSLTGADFELAQTYLAWANVTSDPKEVHRLRREARYLLKRLQLDDIYIPQLQVKGGRRATDATLVGTDSRFEALLRQVELTSSGDIPVLLLGETGTGKDLFAKYLHQRSRRAGKPFVALNCSAIPAELAESELFGHEKGAFTSAAETKIGLLEAAEGGTLFLNEIGELPLKLQVKLLSALEEKHFFRVGGTKPRRVDFRLIAATNVELLQAVQERRFRADLFYRLAVMTVELPRLADRGEDAYELLAHFLKLEGLSLDDVDNYTLEVLRTRMRAYSWPGNIRELRNYVDLFCLTEKRDPRAICLRLIARLNGSGGISTRMAMPSERSVNLTEEVAEFERSLINSALVACNGIIRRAASYLGLPEATLRSKLKKYRISAA